MNNLSSHHSPHQHHVDANSSNSSSFSRPSSSLASSSAKSGSMLGTDTSSCLSSTARLILDTLDKMSTPIRDAQKMSKAFTSLQQFDSSNIVSSCSLGGGDVGEQQMSRAERRRLIADALDASSVSMNLSNSSLSMQDELL